MKSIELRLDSDFICTSLETIPFNLSVFPGGEINFRLLGDTDNIISSPCTVWITQRIKNSDDLMKILMAHDALKRNKFVKNIELVIPYVPYARQDRVCNPGEAFSLKVFCDILNSCNFNKIHILDAHSDVTPALLKNRVNYDNYGFVKNVVNRIIISTKELSIVAPDAEAIKKVYKLVEKLTKDFPEINFSLVTCDKVRNLSTGQIIRTICHNPEEIKIECLIVDDICDGGRTVIEVAKTLKMHGAENIIFAATHGIFSKGFGVFEGYINQIESTNSFCNGINVNTCYQK